VAGYSLLAADEYARLRRHEQKAFHVSELPAAIVDEFGNAAVAEAASKYDHEYEP